MSISYKCVWEIVTVTRTHAETSRLGAARCRELVLGMDHA